MKEECLIFLDTNICIYRTLAYVEPKIYREELRQVTDKINRLTNNNFRCVFIISDLVISELKNDQILFWEINSFCYTKLHLKHSLRILKIFMQAKKSIGKFIDKYGMTNEQYENIKSYPMHINAIEQFYLKYPQKLVELTNSKVNGMNLRQKRDKLSQRLNNLPEETDRKLLAQAIESNRSHHSDVYIFSNDGDFTEFANDIQTEFNIQILKIEDVIPSCVIK